jgi:hypothetical protein
LGRGRISGVSYGFASRSGSLAWLWIVFRSFGVSGLIGYGRFALTGIDGFYGRITFYGSVTSGRGWFLSNFWLG